jgi:formiminotetrahydrofolate cyclodeaminase
LNDERPRPTTNSLWELRLDVLRDQVASRAPTPGGGSVACICATLATGLLVMAAEITRASLTSADTRALDDVLAEGRRLVAALTAHADHDVVAFRGYMAALALPRSSDEEKAARKAALAAAAQQASEAPLAAAQSVTEALALGRRAAKVVKTQVQSDILAGIDLLQGALDAVLRNVDINLPYVGDDETRTRLAAARDQLRALR